MLTFIAFVSIPFVVFNFIYNIYDSPKSTIILGMLTNKLYTAKKNKRNDYVIIANNNKPEPKIY